MEQVTEIRYGKGLSSPDLENPLLLPFAERVLSFNINSTITVCVEKSCEIEYQRGIL